MRFYVKDSGKIPNPRYVPPASKSNKEIKNRYCLFCSRSVYGYAIDGSHVLTCFNLKGFEGKEMIVGEDECCENYNE